MTQLDLKILLLKEKTQIKFHIQKIKNKCKCSKEVKDTPIYRRYPFYSNLRENRTIKGTDSPEVEEKKN